jgi:hypothetical protein
MIGGIHAGTLGEAAAMSSHKESRKLAHEAMIMTLSQELSDECRMNRIKVVYIDGDMT